MPIEAAVQRGVEADHSSLEKRLLLERVSRFARSRPIGTRERLVRLTAGTLVGLSFETSCREAAIPRGSRSRYRAELRRCFRDLAKAEPR